MSIALIVLAAGKGTRMESDLPKVLHPIAHAPLLWHALRAGQALGPDRSVVVAGHGAEAVTASAQAFDPDIHVVVQAEQMGTAHAVATAAPALDGFEGDAIVLYGDTPFISQDTLDKMAVARTHHDLVVLGFVAADPGRYGRLVVEGEDLLRIVEHKDATPQEQAITLCNSGVVAADAVGAGLGDLVLYATGTGSAVAATEVNLSFGISGELAELNVQVGDVVNGRTVRQ